MSSTSLPLTPLRETHGIYVSTMGSESGAATHDGTRSTLRLAAHGLEELVQHHEGHQDGRGRGRPRGRLQLFDRPRPILMNIELHAAGGYVCLPHNRCSPHVVQSRGCQLAAAEAAQQRN